MPAGPHPPCTPTGRFPPCTLTEGEPAMPVKPERTDDNEPPSIATLDDARASALVERVCAVTHLPPSAHVAIIGHRTLPLLLEFLKRGCGAVRSLRPGAPTPDCESADL